jgi:4-hydroxyphenylpyruvate dioxygenase
MSHADGTTGRQRAGGPAEPGTSVIGDQPGTAAGDGGLRGRRSIATVSLSGSLQEKLAAAAAAGFDGVELFADDVAASGMPAREVRLRADSLGLSVMLYQPLRDFEAGPPDRFAENLRRARQTFELMIQLGAPMLLVCSSTAPAAIDDDMYAAAQLRQLACLGAEYGVRVAYEALAWGTCVSSHQHAWRLVAAAAHDNLGICLDSFHILAAGHGISAIRDLPADKIFFLQLADAPLMDLDPKTWSRNHRCFPGHGDLGLAEFAGDVLATGYAGPWSLEIFNPVLRQSEPRELAASAMRSLLDLEALLPRLRAGAYAPQAAVQPAGLVSGGW